MGVKKKSFSSLLEPIKGMIDYEGFAKRILRQWTVEVWVTWG